jgi:hypothetical protein
MVRWKVGMMHEGVKGWGAYNPLPEAFHDCDRRGCTSSIACCKDSERHAVTDGGVVEESRRGCSRQHQCYRRRRDRRAHRGRAAAVNSGRHGGCSRS